MEEFNRYQLHEELKKALHNRKQDNAKYFFYEDFLAIEYNKQLDFIYADWKGTQTENSLIEGCDRLYEALRTFQCSKVLNDNTNVAGIWTLASWVGGSWLHRMKDLGLKYFAWVYSHNEFSQLSIDEAIKTADLPDVVKTFVDIDSAATWLSGK